MDTILNPVDQKDLLNDPSDLATQIKNVHTVVKETPGYVLLPGDVCVCQDDPKQNFGVVIRSKSNNDQVVLVRFGEEPIRDFPRVKLQWCGEVI